MQWLPLKANWINCLRMPEENMPVRCSDASIFRSPLSRQFSSYHSEPAATVKSSMKPRKTLATTNMSRFLFVVITAAFLAACKPDADIVSVIRADTVTLQIYDHGRPLVTQTLDKGSEEYRTIIDWAEANANGWSFSVTGTYRLIVVDVCNGGKTIDTGKTLHVQ